MITHKFREVMAYADDVTVLRRGARSRGATRWPSTTPAQLAADDDRRAAPRASAADAPKAMRCARTDRSERRSRSSVEGLSAMGDRGTLAVRDLSLDGRAPARSSASPASRATASASWSRRSSASARGVGGEVRVAGEPYAARRARTARCSVRACPRSRCATPASASSASPQNMALRDFDQAPLQSGPLRGLTGCATAHGASARAPGSPSTASRRAARTRRSRACRAATCSARCWRASWPATINVLIAANPVFGLDFAAVAEIHARILQVRDAGGAVLLVSEDLDELLELADRIAVMSEGRIVFETPAAAPTAHVSGRTWAATRRQRRRDATEPATVAMHERSPAPYTHERRNATERRRHSLSPSDSVLLRRGAPRWSSSTCSATSSSPAASAHRSATT